ncbi:ubiquitin fusion degradation protein 1 homolog [Panicum virgatum]|uniref:Ubiquitin fusion degradation protein UFD1 N-terminal subdomain 2 domain-containing protein n=1 Tax=Panicum virgatum TaxID=38727 RepID=A0A8T0W9N8_PANVG|nr:ubiquitin fusion degradation protein 1 homolog [Panicum virgatum]KAG2646191.1 hypothetical protein PVAP13_2KG491305 [Panicum virgatum]
MDVETKERERARAGEEHVAATPTFVKLQPYTTDFLDVSHHKDCELEYNFRKFICVTAGETIVVTEGERRYYLDVLEARPGDTTSASRNYVSQVDEHQFYYRSLSRRHK